MFWCANSMRKQSKASYEKHKMVHNWLVKNFPKCNVMYNGSEGIDHRIIFNNNVTFIETKTCNRIIRWGRKKGVKDRPIIFDYYRLGRFKFNKHRKAPYNISQHKDLCDFNGWYIFVVGKKIMAGMPAKNVKLTETESAQMISWCNILKDSHPNWLRYLKAQVYEI